MEVSSDYVAPILRIVRAMSLEEDVRMLVGQTASLNQFLQAVRGTRLAARLQQLRGVEDVERAAWGYMMDALLKLKPLEALMPRTYTAYSLLAVSGWLARLVKAGLRGEEPPRDVPQHPLLRRAARVVAEAGVRALPRLLAEHGLSGLAELLRSPRVEEQAVDLALDLDLVEAFAGAAEEAGGSIGWQHACYRLDALAVRVAGNAALLGSRDVARTVSERLRTCLVQRQRLLDVIEEGSLDRIGAALHATPYQQYMPQRLGPVEAAYHAVRKYSRSRLPGSLAYDPTEPGHAVAVLELLALDVEDVVALATAAFAGLPRETVAEVVTVTG